MTETERYVTWFYDEEQWGIEPADGSKEDLYVAADAMGLSVHDSFTDAKAALLRRMRRRRDDLNDAIRSVRTMRREHSLPTYLGGDR